MSNLNVRMRPVDQEGRERLREWFGGDSAFVRRLMEQADDFYGPVMEFIRERPGLELALCLLEGDNGQTEQDGRVLGWLHSLLDAHFPEWELRHSEAIIAYYGHDDAAPLTTFNDTLRTLIETGFDIARATGTRPWEAAPDVRDDALQRRRERPDEWLTLAQAAASAPTSG